MVQFVEKHGRLLRAYCLIARILGWYLLLAALVGGPFAVLGTSNSTYDELLYGMSSLLYDFMVPALLAFGVAQFIEYLLQPEAKVGWMLRRADMWLYIYGGLLIIKTMFNYTWVLKVKFPDIQSHSLGLLMMIALPAIAKLVVIIGLAVGARRLLPVIEESKTLV